jgi:hypothetical protein
MCLPFCHKWEIKGVMPNIDLTTDSGRGPASVVVRVCSKCSKVKSKYIWGHWTLEQLTGKQPVE